MAGNPDERIGNYEWLESDKDLKDQQIAIPAGYVVGQGKGQYYAGKITHADGHTTIEWFQRQGQGEGKPDAVATTTVGPVNTKQQGIWKADAAKEKPGNVYVGVNPTTGKPTQVTETPDPAAPGGVRRTYDDTQVPAAASGAPPGGKPYLDEEGPNGRRLGWNPATGQYDRDLGSSPSAQAAAAGASDTKPLEGHPGWSVRTTKVGGDTRTAYINPQGQEAPEPPKPGQIVPGTTAAGAQYTGILNPATNEITWTDNPNAVPPATQRWVFRRAADGTVTREKNPYYEKKSTIQKDPNTGRWEQITEDNNGEPIVRAVTPQTTIKPADLPVLQSKYGEIAQGLGQLAQDLNRKYAAGEITAEERKDAFTAAHAQASTQVAEINSILENSKAIWSGQVQQRGQSLSETQSRRSFASDAAGRAISTGQAIATSAGPGHGKAIAAGVQALLGMQQRYAAGMGGFRESPEIGLPPALEQARGIGLPGYGPGSPPAAVSGASGAAGAPPAPSGADVAAANAATQAQSSAAFGRLGIPPPGSGISNTTDAGGVPREYTPASVTGPGSGQPPVAAMGAALGAAESYAGGPVAAGGAGMWDPSMAMQGMLGQGGDLAWEEAVRRAAQAHAQGGYR